MDVSADTLEHEKQDGIGTTVAWETVIPARGLGVPSWRSEISCPLECG